MTGLELRLKRVARQVGVTDLATAIGVHHSRVSQIEALARVTAITQQRYLEALEQFPMPRKVA